MSALEQTGYTRDKNPGLEDTDLQSLVALVWGSRYLILAIAFTVTLLVTLIVLQRPSLYTASTTLMLDTRRGQVDFQSALAGLTIDAGVVQSEMSILGSRAVAYRVMKAGELDKDPEFNPAMLENGGKGIFSNPSLRRLFGADEAADKALETDEGRVIANILDRLELQNEGKSYAIRLSFTSRDPEKAARIANLWADKYLVDQLEVKFEAVERANKWLSLRMAELKQKVSTAESAVAAAREKFNIIESSGENILQKQLADLNTQLVLAQSERAQADARLRRARDIGRSGTGLDAVTDVLQSQLIQRLREQEAEVVRQEADLASRYGERHPTRINKQAEIRDLRVKINEEVGRIISSLESEAEIARARENSLRASIGNLEEKVTLANRSQIQVDQLSRDASSERTLYDTFVDRFKETFGKDSFQQADARIIARADVPVNPSKPKRRLIIIGAFIASLVLGVLVVLVRELLNSTFRSATEMEQLLNLKTLAMIPKLTKKDAATLMPYIRRNAATAYTEAIRSVITALQFLGTAERPSKVVLVTSSVPSEGKSFFAASLANIASLAGKRVLLIDCDLRRPAVAATLDINDSKPQQGLSDYLAGKVALEDILQHEETTGLDFVVTKTKTTVPQAALASEAMQSLLGYARGHYDLIILDMPPLMAVSDAIVLAPFVDHVLYAVRYHATPRKVVHNALKTLQRTVPEASLLAVMTQVDLKMHMAYNYGDVGYYYGRYGEYYAGAKGTV